MDREAWRAAVHGVAKSRTRLTDWTELSAIWEAGLNLEGAPKEPCAQSQAGLGLQPPRAAAEQLVTQPERGPRTQHHRAPQPQEGGLCRGWGVKGPALPRASQSQPPPARFRHQDLCIIHAFPLAGTSSPLHIMDNLLLHEDFSDTCAFIPSFPQAQISIGSILATLGKIVLQ